MRRAAGLTFGWVMLCLGLLSTSLLAQEKAVDSATDYTIDPTTEPSGRLVAISLSWAELEAGCEAPELAPVDAQQCQLQLAQWLADYQAPLQQPGLLLPALDAVLAQLPVTQDAPRSLWSQLWSWLREQLGGGSAGVPAWLRNWQVPETFVDWMLGLTVGACVLMALGIVGNELRQVYRSRAMAYVPGASVTNTGVDIGSHLPTLDDVANCPLQDQPRLLLQIVVSHLQQRALLSRQASRTHQDLLQHAPALGELGTSLAAIAQAAERTTYGNWQISKTQVEPLLVAGERLVAHVVVQDK